MKEIGKRPLYWTVQLKVCGNISLIFSSCLVYFYTITQKIGLLLVKKKKQKIWKSWLPAFWKKIQNTREIKRTLFNWTKQDKTCKFSRKSSFSSSIQHKNRKTNNSTYFVSDVGGWQKEKAFSFCQNQDKLNYLFVFMLYVAWKRGLPGECAHLKALF